MRFSRPQATLREYVHGVGLDGNSDARVRMPYRYNPHGALTQETTAAGTAIYQDALFTGRSLDRETKNADSPGLYYFQVEQPSTLHAKTEGNE